jgi:competence protein ComEC
VFIIGGIFFSIVVAAVPRAWLRAIAFLCFVFFVTAWSISRDVQAYERVRAHIPSSEANYRGTIVERATREDGHQILTARVTSDGSETFLVLVHLKDGAAALAPHAGQSIEVRGWLNPFLAPLSPEHFAGTRFGLVKGLHGTMTIADADALILGAPVQSTYFANHREQFRARLLAAVSPHEAAMLLALLIGDTSLFANDDKAVFKAIGAEHLLAVSGLQISLLAMLCFALLYPLIALILPIGLFHRAKAITALVTLLLSWWFLGLANFSPSAMRAFAMTICLSLPTILLRKIDAIDALFASCFITLLISPTSALDTGFLLSYGAVFGILVAGKHIPLRVRLAHKSIVLRIFCEGFFYSTAAVLATLPIIATQFRVISPFAVIANALLLPFAAIAQIPAIVLSALGCLLDARSLIPIAAFFANLINLAARILAAIFGAALPMPSLSSLGIFLVAMACGLAFLAAIRQSKSFSLSCALCLLWPLFELLPTHDLTVTVMPVGQGDAALFSFDNGTHMLIDAGGESHSDFDPGRAYVLPTLRRRGVKTLDVLVISHPDPDHILGAFAVIEALPIKEIWHSGFKKGHPLTEKLVAMAHERAIAIKTTEEIAGSHRFGQSMVHILAPRGENYYRELSANDNSLVIRITRGPFALLWPGDIEFFGEQLLEASGADLSATIVKAPHHGSRTSSTEAFIDAVNPREVIFSTGRKNRFHFPHEDVVARYERRGARLWNTATDGEITISINNQNFSIDGYQPFKEKT